MSETPTTTSTKAGYARKRPKVPPFARFKGTSVWKQFKRRARAYARYKATQAA